MEFLSLPEGKHVELQTSNAGPASGPCEKNDAWDALDPMTLSDVELGCDACNLEIDFGKECVNVGI